MERGCGLFSSLSEVAPISEQLIDEHNSILAETRRISADCTDADLKVMGGAMPSAIIASVNTTSLGYANSTHVVDGLCILMLLPEVFAQILRELLDYPKHRAPPSNYCFVVEFTVKITQQTLHIISEQRQRCEVLPTHLLALEFAAEPVLDRQRDIECIQVGCSDCVV